jgi:DNA (cytosine-5)-methyltransferase 1
MKPRLLDLFCGAGGAGMGYHRAGFEVVGVDIKPQPRYPFEFHQADALEYLAAHGHEFDAIHASPPCQRYSLGTARWAPEDYPDLLGPVEVALIGRKYFIIENVERAPFHLPTVTLCGQSFGLNVIRHRRFAVNFLVLNLPHLKHPKRGEFVTCAGHGGNGSNSYKVWCEAMGIDWMTKTELAEAIPPAFTEFIGRQLRAHLEAK